MTRACVLFLWLVSPLLLVGSWGAHASAQELAAPDLEPPAADPLRFLPDTLGATVGASAALTSAWGGYDGAAHSPLFSVGTEVRVVRRVSLVAGAAYGSAGASSAGLRPQLGARVQLLRQAASGVDASASFVFRQDRFTSEDGMFQGSLALGRSFGETSAVMTVLYAQDGEGDDHQGELRLAGLRRVRGGLHLGLYGRYMHSLASTDPHRAALGTPSMEASAGPVLAYLLTGSWAVIAEAGVSMRQISRVDTGVTTLGGIATVF